MTRTIHAIYENGVFRPTERVDLPDRCEVEVEVRQVEGVRDRSVSVAALPQESERAGSNGNAVDSRGTPVADFLEPVQFDWTEAGYEARRALKQYSEETHANH
jgi:predicted DNA-binding antitoxin AbrB/MazE fold protein